MVSDAGLIIGILALVLAGLIGLGWLVPLVLGIVRLRRRSGGVVLTVLGGTWALGVGLVGALGWLTYRTFLEFGPGAASPLKVEQFEPAKYQGETGTIVLGYKGESSLEAYQRDGTKALRLSTNDGIVKAPVGNYHVMGYQALAKEQSGAEWVARCSPGARVSVKAGSSTELKLGPPLTASITVKTRGKDQVSMDLKLAGVDGGQYTISKKGGRDEPPSFVALNKAGQVVWKGRFSYG